MASRLCTNCPTIIPKGTGTRCKPCTTAADKARRPNGNPYSTNAHRAGFREPVLARDPIGVVCMTTPSTVADHYPTERVDLIELGLNPNDPKYGRGLCKPCHDKHTAETTPGGWNKRT